MDCTPSVHLTRDVEATPRHRTAFRGEAAFTGFALLREAGQTGAAWRQRQLLTDVQRYHTSGELDYQPVVTPGGKGAYLAGIEPHPTEPFDYCGTERGACASFENRITRISLYSMINFDFLAPAGWMGSRAGLLIAGTDDVYVPAGGTSEVLERLTGPKDLITVDGADHIAFYDQEPCVSNAVDAALAWFGKHV